MAPANHELTSMEHLVDRRRGEDDHQQTWSNAPLPLPRSSWSFDGVRHHAGPALTSSTHAYEPVPSDNEAPSYTVDEPIKNESSTVENAAGDTKSAKVKLFVPFCFQTWVLVVFAFVFAAMLAALEVMYQISSRNQGISTADPSKHYLWTYGPTLVLAVVASLWGQVEYRVKQLMPWKAMTKGPIAADKGLILDYVSIWNVKALFAGLKAKHYAVSLATAGSLLLKLAIIVSTAVLSLEQRLVFRNHEMQLSDTFTFSSDIGRISSVQPTLTTFGAIRYSLPYPAGTGSTFSAQSFKPVHNITGS